MAIQLFVYVERLFGCVIVEGVGFFGWDFQAPILWPNLAFTEIIWNIRVALKCFESSFLGAFQSSIFLLYQLVSWKHLWPIVKAHIGSTWKSSNFQRKMYMEFTKPHYTWLPRNSSVEQEKNYSRINLSYTDTDIFFIL